MDLKILKALENTESLKTNSQMYFFHSLLQHTENFDSNEWLQFQMEVLRVISSIKNQKALHSQSCSTQQQSQSMPYESQPQTFPPPLQQSFTTPIPSHYLQPSYFPLYNQPSIPLSSTQNPLPTSISEPMQNRPTVTTLTSHTSQLPHFPRYDPPSKVLPVSPSQPTKHKVKKITPAEHYENFAKYVHEEDICQARL